VVGAASVVIFVVRIPAIYSPWIVISSLMVTIISSPRRWTASRPIVRSTIGVCVFCICLLLVIGRERVAVVRTRLQRYVRPVPLVSIKVSWPTTVAVSAAVYMVIFGVSASTMLLPGWGREGIPVV